MGDTKEQYVLQIRYHDRQWDKWWPWEELSEQKLREKYGETVEEWKTSCEDWIAMGGRYEYRIVLRRDTLVWETCFAEGREKQS